MADSDVKIYSPKSETAQHDQISEVFDLINYHRSNGNFERARRLGMVLSTLSPAGSDGLAIDVENHFEHAPTQGVLFQLKVLLTFAAETVIQEKINPEFLSIMALNTMHDEISKKHPNFFRSMNDATSFTFYSLALKRGGNKDDNIGEAFAMLCEGSGEEDYIRIGKSMWNIAVAAVEHEIELQNFVK